MARPRSSRHDLTDRPDPTPWFDDASHDPPDDPDGGPPGRRRRGRPARGAAARAELEGPDPRAPEPWVEPAWSTWPGAEHGPQPRPAWVVTEAAAVDTELGVLKTGKEADVHLLERAVPGTQRRSLLAAKRYRSSEHRMFHRDAGYLEGRRVRRSRETRAMANRTDFGRDLLAGQWAAAEFSALGRLWQLGGSIDPADPPSGGASSTSCDPPGLRVPYPVQLRGTEVLLEFVGTPDGVAAPRLAQTRPDPEELASYWEQAVGALRVLAGAGLAHGDLSPYNVLVHGGRLVLIDLPQVVDLVVNPQGAAFLERDVRVVCGWFAARGLAPGRADPEALTADLLAEAGLA